MTITPLTIGSPSASAAELGGADEVRAFTFIIDGAGEAITTGAKKAYIQAPYDCTITGWTILGDQSGSVVIDVWVDDYAAFPPTVADTITASAKPTVTTATKATSTSLTGWSNTITQGDVIEVNVDSVTSFTRLTLMLSVVL